MFKSSLDTIEEFKNVLKQIPDHSYSMPCEDLSGASIGKHTRHIIELYQCLLNGYENGSVCYDARKRDIEIESMVSRAVNELTCIQNSLERPDKPIEISYGAQGELHKVKSNYYREIMYNLEHAIHHHALIKIGISKLLGLKLPESFGVAPATIEYRKSCAQ